MRISDARARTRERIICTRVGLVILVQQVSRTPMESQKEKKKKKGQKPPSVSATSEAARATCDLRRKSREYP